MRETQLQDYRTLERELRTMVACQQRREDNGLEAARTRGNCCLPLMTRGMDEDEEHVTGSSVLGRG